MTRKLNIFLFGMLVLVGLPLYWFQFDASAPDARPKHVNMAELRNLANAISGPLPTAIRFEQLGTRIALHNQLAAGTGLRPIHSGIRAYELVVPNSSPIIIDAGLTPQTAKDSNIADFDARAQQRVDRALSHAEMRLILIDHPIHRGNSAATSPNALRLPDLSGGHAHAVAPGVVAIPQANLPDRTMMVFVKLADGREFLFAGDVAPVPESWLNLRPPGRTLADIGNPEKRTEIMSWLMTINALKRAAPRMAIVAGHDPAPPEGMSWGFVHS